MSISKLGVIALATTLIASIPADADLLVNGSFETGPNPGSFSNLNSGSTAIPGWVVSPSNASGTVDYVGSLWAAADGSRSLDLEGSAGDCVASPPFNCPGGIGQTFATTAGQQYQVTFDLAGNPLNIPAVKTVLVSAAGQSQTFTFDVTGHTTGSMGWVLESWMFTATGDTTTLEFDSADNPHSGWGPALDNVAVNPVSSSAVPEPRPLLLLGLGLIAVIGFRQTFCRN